MRLMRLIGLFLLIFLGASVASAKDIPNLATEVKSRLEIDPNSAFAWIEEQGTSSEVCDIYNQAVRDLYWLDKGAQNLVIIGKNGISFCLNQAKQYENINNQLEVEFKAQAKTIAYNVAANSWPGWGDDGVVITSSEIQAGLEAAKLNLSLALELKKPADKVAAAYWLLSAIQLALGNYADGLGSINSSNEFAIEVGDKAVMAYNLAFKGIILLASGEVREGESLYNSGVSTLKSFQTDDATAYVSQLEVARKIFVK